MEQENRPETRPAEQSPKEEADPIPGKPPRKPYSRKARLLAWLGIAFMVFLTIMYYYVFASGLIIRW